MISYATLGTNDPDAAVKFYDAVLGPLGIERTFFNNGRAGYARAGEANAFLYVRTPHNGQPAVGANGAMLGFKADSPAQVRAFHAAAIAHGGVCEGEPGPRPQYSADLYVAYVRDPVGNKLSAIYEGPLEA